MEILKDTRLPLPRGDYPGEVYLPSEALAHAGPEARKLRKEGVLAAGTAIMGAVGVALSFRYAPHDVALGFVMPSPLYVGLGAASPGFFFEANAVQNPKDSGDKAVQFNRLRKYGIGYRFVWPEEAIRSMQRGAVVFSNKK